MLYGTGNIKYIIYPAGLTRKLALKCKNLTKNEKSIKIIALIYVGVAAFTYALSLRVDRLEAQDEYQIQKESLVFRLK